MNNKKLEMLWKATKALEEAREAMIDAMMEYDVEITSEDFRGINETEERLKNLRDVYRPEYKELTFEMIIGVK